MEAAKTALETTTAKKNDNTIVKQNNKFVEFGQFSAPREIVYLLLLLLLLL